MYSESKNKRVRVSIPITKFESYKIGSSQSQLGILQLIPFRRNFTTVLVNSLFHLIFNIQCFPIVVFIII